MPLPAHMIHYSIWDLDNCVCDDKWRTPLIDWHLEGNERYNRYDAQMIKDTAAHLDVWRAITRLSTPIFFTGRREVWRATTKQWITPNLPVMRDDRLHWLENPLILMRPNGCNDKPVDVKRRMVEQLLPRHGINIESIIAAFDDVPSIIDMYLEYGIPAAVLRVHDPKLAYKPEDL